MSDPFEEAVGRWLARRTAPTETQLTTLRAAARGVPDRGMARPRPIVVLAAVVSVGAVALAAVGLVALGSATPPETSKPPAVATPTVLPSAAAEGGCDVTLPEDPRFPGIVAGGISTQLPPDGTILPEAPGAAVGRIETSWIWETDDPKATITLAGRRLDGEAPALIAEPDPPAPGVPARRWRIVFPTAGCWEVTGKTTGAFLTVVVRAPEVHVDPSATDGTNALQQIVERTVAIDSAHVRATLPLAGGLLGGPESGRIEGEVDVARERADLVGESSEAAAERVEYRIRSGQVRVRLGDDGWTEEPITSVIPASLNREASADALRRLAADPATNPVSTPVPCGERECVSVRFMIRPALGWGLVPPLVGSMISVPGDEPADLPTAAVTVVADAETFVPSRIEVTDAFTGVPHLVVELSEVEPRN